MVIKKRIKKTKGFSLVEVLLSIAVFALAMVGLVSSVLYGQESSVLAGSRSRASFLANEGIEALRNMRDGNFSNLSDGTYGLAISSGRWVFSGTNDVTDNFTRQIVLSTVDANTKRATVSVTWPQNLQRTGSISLDTYLTNWRAPVARGGMLVYGDGGTASDAIRYRTFDPLAGEWSSPLSVADVDTSSTNRYLRAAKIYASFNRNEKILLSRHYNGTSQTIYAQVFNGNSWGNVVSLASWNAGTYLDVQNFDGTYLDNGNFMVVHSDNTNIPKMRIWNGSSWSSSSSLTSLGSGQIPSFVVAKSRPGTNEVMTAFFTQGSDTITEYYSGSSWSSITTHATAAPLATKRFVDFSWSPNNSSTGAIAYASGSNARAVSSKIWIANGSGGGAWGISRTSSNQSSNVGALAIAGASGSNEFQICNKDAAATSSIRCYRAEFSGNILTFSNPSNQVLSAATQTGIQRSFHLGYEFSGALSLAVYSDNTSMAKLKKYDVSSSSWDVAATSLSFSPYSPGTFSTVSLIPSGQGDDIMVLMADNNQDLYSVIWDGANNSVYSAPVGSALNRHGTNGSATTDFWFDFAWDRN